ncbi:unnamed protein product [Mytilus coruscus]|uniref:Uncharacterized protein n=1 Tax=Mytilus coruscus TaxID=42192 RepID=A0A6J8EX70_MYTCO|nr:unnamed protein product [Mytilus coruscus]
MMICLLRNLGGLLTPSNGWDQLPHPNDTLPGAALATLKWYRNQLAHTTLTSMDNNEFTDKWTRVEKALTSLNNGQKPLEVTEILNYDLAGEQAKMEGNLPKNIADANATFVETWLKDDESFYETEGSKLVYAKLQDCNCILVTSNSGLGKTATIRHIALKYKLEGFEIVPKNNLEMEIKREEVEIMCETNYAFPLLCKLVSDDEERFKNRIAFFRQPLLLLRNELDKICNENKKLYCILVICMLYNGSFSRSIFDIDSVECDEKIDRIMQTCGLQKYMSKKELEDSAVSALGSYFVEDSNFFGLFMILLKKLSPIISLRSIPE